MTGSNARSHAATGAEATARVRQNAVVLAGCVVDLGDFGMYTTINDLYDYVCAAVADAILQAYQR